MKRNLCILDPLGKVLILFGFTTLFPLGYAWMGRTEMLSLFNSFVALFTVCMIGGLSAWLIGRKRETDFKIRHASLLVIIIWFFLPALGAYPLLAYTGDDFVDAYFEAVSGLTASGATVLVGIDELPQAIKLWRGLLTWMGGLGLIVLAVAILPNIGVGGRQMMKSEISGPLKDQDLTPQINKTAKGLWLIYGTLTGLCFITYWLCGMEFLDAVVHAFTTVGLGGFSNHDTSFAYFDSLLIETVAVLFMLIAGFNFATHFSAFLAIGNNFFREDLRIIKMRGDATTHGARFTSRVREAYANWTRVYRHDVELKPYLTVLATGCIIVCGAVYFANDMSLGEALREGIFNTVSIATTTGYSSTDYFAAWPLYISFWLLLLANFAACSGSTGGGIKMVRALTVLSRLRIEQVKMLHPNAFTEVKVGGRVIQDSIVSSILFFVIAYIFTILITSLLLLALQHDLDLLTAFSAAMACVSNTGPGLGEVGPGTTYAILNTGATAIAALAMLLGRLELLLFLLLFSRNLWR